jgi:hypothetical protein
MKITTVNRNEVPSKFRAGLMDDVVKRALVLKGTATLKIECESKGEAKRVSYQVQASCRRMGLTKKVERLQRKNIVFVYPITETEEK